MSVVVPALPLGLDPLIAEAKERARRRRLLALALSLLIVAAAATSVVLTRPSSRASVSPLPAHGGPLYSVSALVAYDGARTTLPAGLPAWEAATWGDPVTCQFSALMTNEPGGGCSGVPIVGYDFARISGLQRYPGGGWLTPSLYLVGTWSAHAFHVTTASRVDGEWRDTQPNCGSHGTGPVVRVSTQALTDAFAHTQILQSGPCGHTWSFLVPVADHRTVSYLRHHFGRSVLVVGVLQPAGRR